MAKSAKKTSIKLDTSKGKPWTFPKNTLEDAIQVPKIIEEKNAGNPMRAEDLGRALGWKTNDWRFADLLKSANLYGLVSGTGAKSTVTLEPIGLEVVTPSSPTERKNALLNAFRNVEDFKKVEEFYGSKKIPEDEFFYNTLIRNFGILKDRVDKFAEVFLLNIRFLQSFDISLSNSTRGPDDHGLTQVISGKEKSIQNPRIREFLDTCFVMMPFGEWYDKYYKDIYVLAIKDAGFEPIRADELFTTGSVVEQIWEQINKSKVLLAELTGKNANVFYELGLAHAAIKPVVFVSASVDDVPFDLRHLRVIIYDVREPNWADNLKQKITDYLKNALKEPSKSIPHPFRNDQQMKGEPK